MNSLNGKDTFGNTALHIASMLGHEEIAKDLIQQGASIEIENKE